MNNLRETILDADLEGLSKLLDIISLTVLNNNPTLEDMAYARQLFTEACIQSSTRNIKKGEHSLNMYRDELRKKKQAEQEQAATEGFHFEFKVISMEEIKEDQILTDIRIDRILVNAAGMSLIGISKEWINMSKINQEKHINKKYVYKESNTPSVAFQIANPGFTSSSLEQRDNMVFIDETKKIPDWGSTLNNLKDYVQKNAYSEKMTSTALLNMIRSVTPGDEEFYRGMSANQIAEHLLQSAQKVDKLIIYRDQLKELERTPEQPLPFIMEKARMIIDKICTGPEEIQIRESKLLQALVSFVHDKIAENLQQEIRKRRDSNRRCDVTHLTELAMKIELRESLQPTSNLCFGRKIGTNSEFMNIRNTIAEDIDSKKKKK